MARKDTYSDKECFHSYNQNNIGLIQNHDVKIHSFYIHELEGSRVSLFNIIKNIKEIQSKDIIELNLASPGGYMDEAYRLINEFQNTGARIITKINPEAMSAAAYIFMIGEKRVIYESSTLMFHNYKSTVSGRGQVITSYTEYYNKLTFDIIDELVPQLTSDEINNILSGNDLYFGAYEMCQRGLATHIIVGDIEIPSDLYIELVDKYSYDELQSTQKSPKSYSYTKTLKNILKVHPNILDEFKNTKDDEINDLITSIESKITQLKNKLF